MVVSVTLNELQTGLKASKFTAVLDTKDNKYKLDVSFIFNYFIMGIITLFYTFLDFERRFISK